jgi:O-antigen ligase
MIPITASQVKSGAAYLVIFAGIAVFILTISPLENSKDMWTYTFILLFGVFIAPFFLVRPFEVILGYFTLYPTLQVFNDLKMKAPGTGIHAGQEMTGSMTGSMTAFSFGGVILTLILVFGGIACINGFSKAYRRASGIIALFGLFFIWMLIGIFTNISSLDIIQALKELGRILGIFVIFLLGLRYSNDFKDIYKLIGGYCLSLLVPVIVAIYQIIYGTEYLRLEHYNRIMGTFGIPNMFAMYLIFPLVMLLIFTFDKSSSWLIRIASAAAAAFLLIVLFLTYTRASWLAFVMAALYIGGVKYRRLLPLILIAGIILFSIFSLESLRLGSSGSSGRLGIWEQLFPAGMSAPVIGHGLTSMGALSKSILGDTNQGQNQFLLYWIEGGAVGAGIFTALITVLFLHSRRCYKALKGTMHGNLYLGFIAFLIGMCTISLFESNTIFQNWVWFPSGIFIGAYYNRNTQFPAEAWTNAPPP